MTFSIYLSGEIHTDWREQIKQGIANNNLNITVYGPVTDHDISDNVGIAILGSEENAFWKDHKGSKINALRTGTFIKKADIVIIRFGDKYKQWNAAYDAGLATGLGKPIIVMHAADLNHPLKEIDGTALAVTETPQQVVEILKYISRPA